MLDILDPIHGLGLRPENPVFRAEKRRHFTQQDVAVFGDGRGQYPAAMLLVISRIVRPTAHQGNAVWRARDDHAKSSPRCLQ